MELKVWVEGIQRIVCGVTVNTTCQDVVFALAHATGKVGRFTLIERWRNNERLLAPNENPLKLLLKWGEYANDVQFILQRSENKLQTTTSTTQQQQQTQRTTNATTESNAVTTTQRSINNNSPQTQAVIMKKPLGVSNTNNSNSNISNNSYVNNNNKNNNNVNTSHSNISSNIVGKELNLQAASERTKELKKSFGAYDKQIENVGIVKGVPQQQRHNLIAKYSPTNNNVTIKSTLKQPPAVTVASFNIKQNTSTTTTSTSSAIPLIIPKHEKSHSNPIEMTNSNSNNNSSNSSNLQTAKSAFNINNNNNNYNSNNIYAQMGARNSKSTNEINLADVRESLDRRTLTPTYANNSSSITNNNSRSNNNNNNNFNATNSKHSQYSSEENLLDVYNGNSQRYGNCNKLRDSPSNIMPTAATESPELYKNSTPTPTISVNGALVPPPYRNPPPPRNSPLQRMQNEISHSPAMSVGGSSSGGGSVHPPLPAATTTANAFLNDYSNVYEDDFQLYATPMKNHSNANNSNSNTNANTSANNSNSNNFNISSSTDESESSFQATQYTDLLQLIKFQREKISAQQLELTKYDAEIVFLENKERDQAQELETISREITKADQIFRQGSEQLQALQYVEEENELVKQQEKTLKSEIALLRSKLANCETEFLQCKNKIRLLMDDIEIEQRAVTQKQKNNRQNFERDFLMEMERIQNDIDQAIMNTDTSNKTAENLKKEIALIEQAIGEKKRQVEKLVNEMKEVNLQSLQVTTSDEIKNLLEVPNKQGSSRRIIGSPRQLENAVPTSKNPHGVWV